MNLVSHEEASAEACLAGLKAALVAPGGVQLARCGSWRAGRVAAGRQQLAVRKLCGSSCALVLGLLCLLSLLCPLTRLSPSRLCPLSPQGRR